MPEPATYPTRITKQQWPKTALETLACSPQEQAADYSPVGARTLLGAPGIATRSKDATRGSWPYY